MRIDFDRISKLAGLAPNSNRRGLYEAAEPEGEATAESIMDEDAFDPNEIPVDEDADIEVSETDLDNVGINEIIFISNYIP